jgi:hypothetical protein
MKMELGRGFGKGAVALFFVGVRTRSPNLSQLALQNMGLISEIISAARSMDCLEQISLPGQTGQVVVSTAGNRTAIHRAVRAGQLRKLAT